ncbi:hypothetical protein C1I91_14485 [Clostridium manihotivorum]|uniref:Uncharacterized protein n=1 Tax=Clostridium manihotivorum TaxID=2320868 RepID=A0A410DUM0_9CLOT|nr:hypothetical protein C1I91_14485 [Clostridium manihotivorum]
MEVIKIKGLLKEKKGNALPFACAIVMSLIIIFSGISEYLRLQMIAKGVRDALEASIISVAAANYDEVYNGLREGYSGGYYLSSDNKWESKLDNGDIYSELSNLLGLKKEGGYYVKLSNGKAEFKVSDLKVNVINTSLAPTETSGNQRFQAEAFILLEVPIGFGFDKGPPLKINLKVVSGYTPKF